MSPPAVPVDPGTRDRLRARFGSGVESWLDELPSAVAALAKRWGLEVGDPIPRGTMSAVIRCRRSFDGAQAVLKVSPDRARLAREAAALQGWRGSHTTPAVLAVDETAGALLMEAIEPGTPLIVSRAYPSDPEIAGLITSLHERPAADLSFQTVEERSAHLFVSSLTLHARHPELEAVVPRALHDRGQALAERLSRDERPSVLLHGDLTPSNILDGGPNRGLVAIDPAPCLGDPAFDAVDLVLWRAHDIGTIEARSRRLAATAGLDPGRLLAWCTAFAAMIALELASRDGARSPELRALLDLASRA
jgi:streptomycin 6-kinase